MLTFDSVLKLRWKICAIVTPASSPGPTQEANTPGKSCAEGRSVRENTRNLGRGRRDGRAKEKALPIAVTAFSGMATKCPGARASFPQPRPVRGAVDWR